MPDLFLLIAPVLLLPVVALLRFLGCTSFGAEDSPAPPPVAVTIAPTTATLGPGKGTVFTATVTGSPNLAVSWTAGAGKVTPTVNPAPPTINFAQAVYTAPAPFDPKKTSDTVTAASAADSTKSASATITLAPPTPVIRVNCGGATIPDPARPWSADTSFTGGSAFPASGLAGAVTDTTTGLPASPIYQTCRYGNDFTYDFAVPPGSYFVTLKFAEIATDKGGPTRAFNFTVVSGAGASSGRSNYDISAAAGGDFRSKDEIFPVTVDATGKITIHFTQGPATGPNANLALINAIEIAQ